MNAIPLEEYVNDPSEYRRSILDGDSFLPESASWRFRAREMEPYMPSQAPGSPWFTVKKPLDCTADQTAAAQLLANRAEGGAPLRLSPCDLYPYLRGRTLWLIGDSNTRSLFRAAQCFLLDLWEDQRVCAPSTDPNLVRQLDALPLKPGTPKCIHLAGGGRVCMVHVVQGWALANNTQVAGGGVLPLLYSNFSSPHDIVVVNFGNWHGPRAEPKSQEYVLAYKQALRLLGSFYLATVETRPHLIFHESASTHPYHPASRACVDYPDPAAVGGGSFNKAAQEVLRDYGVPVVGDAAAFTAPAPWGHPGARAQGGRDGVEQGDCMHFCSPGVTELLLWTLWQAFNKGVAGIAPLPPDVGATEWGCSEMRYY
ncbi:hypothetical protein MNEG_5069 [Monoraphidium neglectum]|uniref:Uncharacterized protein n=1 Tax=Monoraphidium neglectum TaxID=145388 RepID=A0A0D2JVW8_9CHLO|nr:hypothetical protein MNEG_5069 [Monoraphidium neglectum]KIZ02893.1 hypothetical protein MNEG_5069 [Monoraphidium neglectum]|eukprot:XP_013901912.1 hypothetical protein MNEG_5069 [Monoraphidium neglectum]